MFGTVSDWEQGSLPQDVEHGFGSSWFFEKKLYFSSYFLNKYLKSATRCPVIACESLHDVFEIGQSSLVGHWVCVEAIFGSFRIVINCINFSINVDLFYMSS